MQLLVIQSNLCEVICNDEHLPLFESPLQIRNCWHSPSTSMMDWESASASDSLDSMTIRPTTLMCFYCTER